MLSRRHWSSDNAAAIVLAIAALATAWSSYQASVWGGVQAAQYTRAAQFNAKSANANAQAQRLRLLDETLFGQWLNAYANRQPRLIAFYEAHFRPEFRDAFNAWYRDSVTRESATPFEDDEYLSAKAHESDTLAMIGARAFSLGEHANEVSDHYVFTTVVFASVLFFAGAIRPLVSPHLRGFMLLLATLLCAVALVHVVIEPIAH